MIMVASQLEPSEANIRRPSTPLLVALCVLGFGCRETYVDDTTDRLPVAVARALDRSGVPADSSVNGGLGPIFPFTGKAIEVTLDGTASHDMDGTIVAYRWLSATSPDAGAGRELPQGDEPGWPQDVKQPRVELSEGAWAFSLWVTDNQGAVSDPDTIKLVVGEAPEEDAGVEP
jgi:hypothetical protein